MLHVGWGALWFTCVRRAEFWQLEHWKGISGPGLIAPSLLDTSVRGSPVYLANIMVLRDLFLSSPCAPGRWAVWRQSRAACPAVCFEHTQVNKWLIVEGCQQLSSTLSDCTTATLSLTLNFMVLWTIPCFWLNKTETSNFLDFEETDSSSNSKDIWKYLLKKI